MSGLAVAYWQKVFDENLPRIEKILHAKLDKLEKLNQIPFEDLKDWQLMQMKEIEDETICFVGFLEINKKTQNSYLEETTKVADFQLKIWTENEQLKVENQLLKQEIVQKENLIEVLLLKYSQTLKKILKQ